MRRRSSLLAVSLLAVALACAGGAGNGPAYPEVLAAAAPLAPGRARLVVYRTLYTAAEGFHPEIALDGRGAGSLPEGTFLWLEAAAGPHELSLPPVASYAAFGAQMPTPPLALDLAAGTTTYVSLDGVAAAADVQPSLAIVGAARAQSDLSTLERAPAGP
ncbi:MAG TPA: hypothetical protein VMW35_08575 [Myxococcota bacterium]|nr:hypothetical protein [Myxococcota bacterium]